MKTKDIHIINKKRRIFKSFRILKHPVALVFYIIMVLYVLSLVVPSIWMILTTFKDRLEFRANRFGLPSKLFFENYYNVFDKMYVQVITDGAITRVYMPRLMLNGLLYSIFTTVCGLFVQILVSYGCAKYKSKVGGFLYKFAIVTMILPITGSLAAQLIVYRALHLYDNFFGMLIVHSGWGGSIFLILYAAFKSINEDYRSSAFIDGASHARVLFSIMIPMIKTTIIAFVILHFISCWNDYMAPMLFLPSFPTIAYGLFQFRQSTDNIVSSVTMQMTGAVIIMIPIMIIFLFLRNKIMGNLAMGGIKG